MDTSPRQPSTLSPKAELALLNLQSALRRRGLSAKDGELPGSVVASNGTRTILVRFIAGRWYRPMSGQTKTNVPVSAEGAEEALARHIARELAERLP